MDCQWEVMVCGEAEGKEDEEDCGEGNVSSPHRGPARANVIVLQLGETKL